MKRNLGVAVSILTSAIRHFEELMDDINLFHGECGQDFWNNTKSAAAMACFLSTGMNPAYVVREVENRCGEKVAYKLGLRIFL